MKLPASKIEAAIMRKNDGREFATRANLNVEKARIEVTNGHYLTVVPVEIDDGDTTGPVSLDAIKHARKVAGRNGTAQLGANGAYSFPDGSTMPRDDAGGYPDVDRVLPETPDREPDLVIDAEYLATIAKAIGEGRCGSIVSIWKGDASYDALTIQCNTEATAALMPFRR